MRRIPWIDLLGGLLVLGMLALVPMFGGILVLSLLVGWICFKFRLRE